jgi:hypothetical protein
MGFFDRIAEAAEQKPTPTAMPDRVTDFDRAIQAPAAEPDPAAAREPINTLMAQERVEAPQIEAKQAADAAAARAPMNEQLQKERADAPQIEADAAAAAAAARAPMNQHMINERADAAAAAPPAEPAAAAPEAPAVPSATAVAADPEISREAARSGDESFLQGVSGQAGAKAPDAAKGQRGLKFGDKLAALAKKFGVPILHLLQAGAYGYTGNQQETVLQKLQKDKAERQKTAEGRAYEERIKQTDRDFAERMAAVQRQYEKDAATARSAEERQQAEYNATQAMSRLKEEGRMAYDRAQLEAGARGGAGPVGRDPLKDFDSLIGKP